MTELPTKPAETSAYSATSGAEASPNEIHARLAALVETHFGGRRATSVGELLDVLEEEVSKLARADARKTPMAGMVEEDRSRAIVPNDAERRQARRIDFELRSWVEAPTSEQRIVFFAEELAQARARVQPSAPLSAEAMLEANVGATADVT